MSMQYFEVKIYETRPKLTAVLEPSRLSVVFRRRPARVQTTDSRFSGHVQVSV